MDSQIISSRSLAELTSLLSAIEEPAVLLSPDYHILAGNPAYRNSYGDDRPIHNRTCYEVSHHYDAPCDLSGEVCPLKNCLSSGQPQRVLHLHHTPFGEEHVDVHLTPIRNEQGEIIYLLEKMLKTRSASSIPVAEGLVGRSPPFNRMLELIHRAAPSETTVLLLGESGTGKELVARAIHQESGRAEGPFVAVECSGLTESLFESELFGHEKGAFTGAHSRKIGLVESARGGTLFLDEVGDIPLNLQVKLLRLLETSSFRRVGGVDTIEADFRLLLATHHGLKDMVQQQRFRQDLYYRISVFPIHLPPLRERGEDLLLLTESLLQRISPDRHWQIDDEACERLQHYGFPGNIRELRNILERATLLAEGDTLCLEHLPRELREETPVLDAFAAAPSLQPLAEVEKQYLRYVSRKYRQKDRRWLAEQLGLSERTLYRKLQQLGD
jgi:DNA-binding NtrC family response regulator